MEGRAGFPGGRLVRSRPGGNDPHARGHGRSELRRIDSEGVIETIAGDGEDDFGGDGGPAIDAQLAPTDTVVDAAGNVYIADAGNHRVRRIGTDGIIETVAGNGGADFGGDGGPATEAALNRPIDVAVDAAGNLYIADFGNSRIRVVDPPADDHGDAAACATPLTLGVPMPGRIEDGADEDWFRIVLSEPASVAIYSTGDLDSYGGLRNESGTQLANDNDSGAGANFHIERDLQAGVYYMRVNSTGTATGDYTLHGRLFVDVALSQTGSDAIRVWRTATGGWTLDPETGEPFASGGEVLASNGVRYTLTLGSGGVWTASPVAGSCEASLAGTIRTLGGTIGTFAGTGDAGFGGDGGPATQARLTFPFDVAVDASGSVYVADTFNHRIRRIGTDGTIETFAGTGEGGYGGDGGSATEAQLLNPTGVAVSGAGYVFVADWGNERVRRIAPDGTIATFAGTGVQGYGGDGGAAVQAQLYGPSGVTVDAMGRVYIADTSSHRVRVVDLAEGCR